MEVINCLLCEADTNVVHTLAARNATVAHDTALDALTLDSAGCRSRWGSD